MPKDFKVFVDLPNYIHSSNGTRCIKELIKEFEYYNIKTIKISRDTSIINRLKQLFFHYYSSKIAYLFKTKANIGDCFLACDTTPIHLIKLARKHNLKIIWWQLAPYRFLGGKQIPKEGDYSLPFSSYCDPEAKNFFYYQPEIDEDWKESLQFMRKRKKKKFLKLCLYTGKGRIFDLDEDIKNLFPNYKIEIITRKKPSIRSEYFNLLVNCDGLISFDELTQTNLEAASLGIPVYIPNPIFKNKCIRKFDLKVLKERITSSPEIFISNIKKADTPFEIFDINYLRSSNKKTIDNFIKIIKGELIIHPLTKIDIKRFKKYTKNLNSEKTFSPIINGGQSLSSLLIEIYIHNLMNRKRYPYLKNLLKLIDLIGYILYKIGLLRLIEIAFFKIKRIYFILKS